ncbi:hypothetical protein DMUE_2599 [Dictyocoela muelleri]|nr:hypothetical protein DMUE_2599 [Dictyocoela muelleri]
MSRPPQQHDSYSSSSSDSISSEYKSLRRHPNFRKYDFDISLKIDFTKESFYEYLTNNLDLFINRSIITTRQLILNVDLFIDYYIDCKIIYQYLTSDNYDFNFFFFELFVNFMNLIKNLDSIIYYTEILKFWMKRNPKLLVIDREYMKMLIMRNSLPNYPELIISFMQLNQKELLFFNYMVTNTNFIGHLIKNYNDNVGRLLICMAQNEFYLNLIQTHAGRLLKIFIKSANPLLFEILMKIKNETAENEKIEKSLIRNLERNNYFHCLMPIKYFKRTPAIKPVGEVRVIHDNIGENLNDNHNNKDKHNNNDKHYNNDKHGNNNNKDDKYKLDNDNYKDDVNDKLNNNNFTNEKFKKSINSNEYNDVTENNVNKDNNDKADNNVKLDDNDINLNNSPSNSHSNYETKSISRNGDSDKNISKINKPVINHEKYDSPTDKENLIFEIEEYSFSEDISETFINAEKLSLEIDDKLCFTPLKCILNKNCVCKYLPLFEDKYSLGEEVFCKNQYFTNNSYVVKFNKNSKYNKYEDNKYNEYGDNNYNEYGDNKYDEDKNNKYNEYEDNKYNNKSNINLQKNPILNPDTPIPISCLLKIKLLIFFIDKSIDIIKKINLHTNLTYLFFTYINCSYIHQLYLDFLSYFIQNDQEFLKNIINEYFISKLFEYSRNYFLTINNKFPKYVGIYAYIIKIVSLLEKQIMMKIRFMKNELLREDENGKEKKIHFERTFQKGFGNKDWSFGDISEKDNYCKDYSYDDKKSEKSINDDKNNNYGKYNSDDKVIYDDKYANYDKYHIDEKYNNYDKKTLDTRDKNLNDKVNINTKSDNYSTLKNQNFGNYSASKKDNSSNYDKSTNINDPLLYTETNIKNLEHYLIVKEGLFDKEVTKEEINYSEADYFLEYCYDEVFLNYIFESCLWCLPDSIILNNDFKTKDEERNKQSK